jgi:hypothetical protein
MNPIVDEGKYYVKPDPRRHPGILIVDLSTPPPTPPHSSGGESSEDLDDLRAKTRKSSKSSGFPPFIEEGGQGGW